MPCRVLALHVKYYIYGLIIMLNKNEIVELMNYSLSTGADFCEFYFENFRCDYCSMINNEINLFKTEIRCGIGIKIIFGDKIYYSSLNKLDKEFIKSNIKKIITNYNGASKKSFSQFKLSSYDAFLSRNEDINSIVIDPEFIKKILSLVNNGALEYSSKIKKAITNYYKSVKNFFVFNSEHINSSDIKRLTKISVNSIAQDGEKTEEGINFFGGQDDKELYDDIYLKQIGAKASKMALSLLKSIPCPSGTMPVVIGNGIGGILIHESCGHLLEANMTNIDTKVFINNNDKIIANPCLNVSDDPTLCNKWGSFYYDDEGYKTFKTKLIENGKLKSLLYDTAGANILRIKDHCNSRRESYRYEGTPRMSNTFIENGTDSLTEIFKDINKGIYAKSFMGGNVDIEGNFNFAFKEAYLIENGKVSYPVKGGILIGNAKEILFEIDKIANDLDFSIALCYASSGTLPVCVGQPTVRVRKMLVGGME